MEFFGNLQRFYEIFLSIYALSGYKFDQFWTPEAGSGYKWGQIIRVQTGIWRTDLWGDMQGSSSGVYPACCEDAPVPRRAKARRTDAPAAGLPGKVADTRIHHHHVMCDCHGHNANFETSHCDLTYPVGLAYVYTGLECSVHHQNHQCNVAMC